jgi:hypothetical protein
LGEGKINSENKLIQTKKDYAGGKITMESKMKLVAGPGKVSARLLTAEEIQALGLGEVDKPYTYGLVTSLGWSFKHITEGLIVIFDINAAVKVFPDTYILEGKDIIGKFPQPGDASGFLRHEPPRKTTEDKFF